MPTEIRIDEADSPLISIGIDSKNLTFIMGKNRTFSILTSIKRFWGRLVFRYAGRNLCSHNPVLVRRFYNVIGKMYDWLYTEHIEGYQKAATELVNSYIQPNDRILDIGCGTGILTELAASKSALIVGVDLSFKMIKQARTKCSPFAHVHFIVGDCCLLPIQTEFDKIISSFMMVTLSEEGKREILKEIYPLLHKDGEAIFLTSHEQISHQWLSGKEWKDLSNSAGFQHIEIENLYEFFRIVRIRKKASH